MASFAFQKLDRSIIEAFVQEADASSHYERSSSTATLTVKDLNDGQTIRHETLLLEVLEAWKRLMEAMKKNRVFVEYAKNLWVAFKSLKSIDKSVYCHLNVLINLLVNTVINQSRDSSTECRFVTLLEVLLSYGSQWQPSEEVSKFWKRLMQRIPAEVPAINFRRKAYRVLVSLSWVPSSKGLLEACSFDATKQTIDPTKAPPCITKHFDKIRARPQPRHDCVNQLLDRLKDETDVCVAITSDSEGMGKTTLASLVSSHPSILKVFNVQWLDLENETCTLSYESYLRLLDILCRQLGVSLVWPECVRRFEEPALRRLREAAAMQEAKELFSESLLEREENLLLVLDDVGDSSLIQWFRFNDRQSCIVTTSKSSLDGVDWTVDLGPMSVDEAIEVFLSEANFATNHVLGLTVELRTIVERCHYHPLTIRTVARWFAMKHVTAGLVKGMQELAHEISNLGSRDLHDGELGDEKADDESVQIPLIYDIMSLLLGPRRIDGDATSILFVMCLSSLVVIFPGRTPLDTVLLLWERILKIEPHAIAEMMKDEELPSSLELKKHACFVVEGLLHLGLIEVIDIRSNAVVEVHHKVYKEFASYMAKEMDLADTYEETVINWNKAYVTAYFTQRIEGTVDKCEDNSWEYSIEHLPSHIFKAKMYPMAETVLGEEHFLCARIDAMGWDKAVDVHLKDCIKLQQMLERNEHEETGYGLFIGQLSTVFGHTSSIIRGQAQKADGSPDPGLLVEIGKALYKIGTALTEIKHYEDAIQHFEEAQAIMPHSQELRASILYSSSWAMLAANHTESALKKIRRSRQIMEQHVPDHILYKEALQLQGLALVGEFEYKEALAFYDDIVERIRPNASHSRLEFGVLLYGKGWVEMTVGQLERAKETFNECILWKTEKGETSRGLSWAYAVLGDIAIEQRSAADAREYYDKAVMVLDRMKSGADDIDHLLVTGKSRILRKDYDGSLDVLRSACEKTKTHPRLFLDRSAYDLRQIARAHQSRGDIETAIEVLGDSLALTDHRLYSLERSAGLHELAKYLLDQEDPHQGLICLEQSLEICILQLGECVQLLDTLNAIGNVHMSLGAHDEALTVFNKVDELTRRIAPNDVERAAGVLYSIGEVHDANKEFTEAIEKFNRCMEVLKRENTEDHPHIAKALQRLGDVSSAQNDLSKAFSFYAEALRIRKMHNDQRLLAETYHSIGVLKRKRKQYEAANEMLLDALDIRKNLDTARETGETFFELGNIHRMQNEFESAIELYETSLEVLAEKDDIRGSVYLALGHSRLFKRQDIKTLDCYERAREIRLAAYGKDNLKTGNVARSLGIIKYLLNKGDEALVHLNEFVRVIELNDDKDNEEEGKDVDYVVAVLLMFDIHQANRRFVQAKGLIEVAKDVCNDSEEVLEQLPALKAMTQRRFRELEDKEEKVDDDVVEKKKGFLARLNLSDDAGIVGRLLIDAEEEQILRKVQFIDD
jgi:tetratricopeptide (TPR) repeat protein